MKYKVTISTSDIFKDSEIVDLINEEYEENYLSLSDIPKDVINDFFSNCWEFNMESEITLTKYHEED